MGKCPKCGGVVTRQSGMRRCRKCQYVVGTQDATIHPPTNYMGHSFASIPADEYEEETLMRDKPGKQDIPLDFEPRGRERYEWRHEALEAMKLKR